MGMLMIGPAIDGSPTTDIREVSDSEIAAYQAADFQRLETLIRDDWVNDGGFRYSEWGSKFAEARIVAPTSGAVDGENKTFTFSGPITACCLNGKVFNYWGTIDGSTFTFDSAPVEGDNVTGLIGVR